MRRFVLSMLLLSAPTLALAQAAPPADSVLLPLYSCAEKTDPMARLACFDAAVSDLKGKEARKEVVAIDQARVQTLRREAFGFRIPSLPKLGIPDFGASKDDGIDDKQVKAITEVLGSALKTTDGQTWQLTETVNFFPPRRRPFNVIIRQAALGTYLLQIEGGNRSWRAKRVD
jgi:hypothetical protein